MSSFLCFIKYGLSVLFRKIGLLKFNLEKKINKPTGKTLPSFRMRVGIDKTGDDAR
jgi:hypothetical protein